MTLHLNNFLLIPTTHPTTRLHPDQINKHIRTHRTGEKRQMTKKYIIIINVSLPIIIQQNTREKNGIYNSRVCIMVRYVHMYVYHWVSGFHNNNKSTDHLRRNLPAWPGEKSDPEGGEGSRRQSQFTAHLPHHWITHLNAKFAREWKEMYWITAICK